MKQNLLFDVLEIHNAPDFGFPERQLAQNLAFRKAKFGVLESCAQSVKETSKLYCYYKMDRPFLRVAPFKVEIVRFNPLAVLFRNVIVDEEIERIQELAKPKLARATVQNSQTGQLETASYRISKSAWLKASADEVVERINTRLNWMTNLEMETAEELQIANYGIGGHYDPHYDFARKEEKKAFSDLGTGNRIATALFYFTQPEKGGYTVINCKL
uniref:P4Hc domain-containing protein n=1 Tax=Globodera pallida TaxID=36090 RepID=A0A183BT59_GLOPA